MTSKIRTAERLNFKCTFMDLTHDITLNGVPCYTHVYKQHANLHVSTCCLCHQTSGASPGAFIPGQHATCLEVARLLIAVMSPDMWAMLISIHSFVRLSFQSRIPVRTCLAQWHICHDGSIIFHIPAIEPPPTY